MYYALPLPGGILTRPGGRPEAHTLPRSAIPLTPEQHAQLVATPGCLRWDGAAVVAVTAADTLAVALRRKLRELHAERSQREQQGVSHQFPDGTGTVQLQWGRDITNISGVATTGLALAGRGVTAAALAVTDQEGHTHALTPEQAQDVGLAVSTRIAALYAAALAHEAALRGLSTAEAVAGYELAAGWPG